MKNTNNLIEECFLIMTKQHIKFFILEQLILFSILYLLKIILTCFNLFEFVEIYYYIGFLIGTLLHQYKIRQLCKNIDILVNLIKDKVK